MLWESTTRRWGVSTCSIILWHATGIFTSIYIHIIYSVQIIYHYKQYLFLTVRIPFRIKKWWYPFYSWSLSASAVNAWRLRMATRGIKEPYLDFLRELCIEMLSTHGKEPNKRRSVTAAGEARFVKKKFAYYSTVQ